MIRRRKRRRRGASACSTLAFAKGPTRGEEKEAQAIVDAENRRAVRIGVRRRDMECRARCGSVSAHLWLLAHVHEEPPRSQGGDPLDQRCCLWLCPTCHGKRQPKLVGGGPQTLWIRIVNPELGTDGPVQFFDSEAQRTWVTLPLGPIAA